ncbi:MAG TPA: hypothetical protein VMC84_00425 [Methanocella sp.]|uniref:hypothetical protein n=1 Tax=Methanocella sp. TaxID=2052833 RepID=UPI002CB7A660|nr:hypothetical protein [Methanocella sp.]HTY89621.1 hypothetical protein [Methanocella sp.]
MSNGKSLSSGGFKPAGSLSTIVVIVLVVVVLILCAGVFMLYNNEKGASNDAASARQAYTALNESYNDLSGRYTALVANNADLSQRYDILNADYKNTSADYASLKNQSETTTVKLGEFLENDPAVAYNYNIMSNTTNNNTTTLDVKVNVYNVCKTDVSNVVVKLTIQSMADNSTGELVKTIASIPTLGSSSVDFTLDNTSRVQSVWANLA